jgi:hypothetical protein
MWKNEIGGGMWHVWGRGDLTTGFQWGNQKETHSLGEPDCRWGAYIKMNLQEIGFEAWTVFI